MTPTLTGALADHPALDQWVAFPAPGRITIRTGKVEIGQGVLTAMRQLAAEEFDVAPDCVAMSSGDTDFTPNEGFTAGSQSMQFGGVALRQACAEVRTLFLSYAAERLGCAVAELSIADGRVMRGGIATGEDYWTLASLVKPGTKATGVAPRKPAAGYSVVGRSAARIDLPAKVFGAPAFIHDMILGGMRHARAVRQPQRGATIASIDEAAIRRAARGEIEFVRHGNFLAIVGDDETAVEAAAIAAATHVTWHGVEPLNRQQQQASSLLQQPTIDRTVGAPASDAAGRGGRYEATYSRGYLAHAAIAPSCALAEFRDGHLTVWTHAQGVFPLRAALAQSLGLDAKNISVRHVQGPGCYGHNGADDVAADAAIIAMQKPGTPIRVRWRREEEFAFEPVSPAMVVKVRAALDDAGKPTDWTAEIWSGTHSGDAPAAATCSPRRHCPIRRLNIRPPTCRMRPAAARRAMGRHSTTWRPSASCITSCRRRRYALRRCAGSAPCRTCSRSSASSTSSPSAPARTRCSIAWRSPPTRARGP